MFASLHTSTLTVRRVETRGSLTDFASLHLKRVRAAFIARRQRKALSRLDAFLLADIGLTAREAAEEAARPLWDVPQTWRRCL